MMKVLYWKTLILLCALLSITACDSQRKVARSEAVIAVIGDSIGNGYNFATPWPTLISEELGVPVHNTSVSNMQTGWGLEVIDEIIASKKPTHLLISLGSNDAARGPSLETAAENLNEMVRRARQKKIIVLVGNIIPNLNSKKAEARAMILNQSFATIENITLVDSRAKMGDGLGLLADGIHPNQQGQRLLAQAFLEALNSTFAEE